MLKFQTAIQEARDHLVQVQDTPVPECDLNSPAHLAFDPYIGRQLQMATPIRVIVPPSFEQTCQTVAHYLDGLEELGLLASVPKISTWKVNAASSFGLSRLIGLTRSQVTCDNTCPALSNKHHMSVLSLRCVFGRS